MRPFALALAFDAAVLALLVHAWQLGLVQVALAADVTGVIVPAILAVTALGLVGALWALWIACRWREFRPRAVLHYVPQALTMLGFLGTLVGFYLAISALDPATITDASMAASTLGEVLAGVGVAIVTTICGVIGSLWVAVNLRVLRNACG